MYICICMEYTYMFCSVFWYIIKCSHIHAKYSACLLCFTIIPSIYCPFLPKGKGNNHSENPSFASIPIPPVWRYPKSLQFFVNGNRLLPFSQLNESKWRKGIIQNFWPGQKGSKLIMFFGPSPCSISFSNLSFHSHKESKPTSFNAKGPQNW